MSGHNLTVDGEFRYIIRWFCEWSELQRDDFLPILVDYLVDGKEVYMNGVVHEMENAGCSDKPLSLFQCRIKLFKEWSRKWPEEFKLNLKEKIIELDSHIGEKLQEELDNTVVQNGIMVITPEENPTLPAEEVDEIQAEVAQNA